MLLLLFSIIAEVYNNSVCDGNPINVTHPTIEYSKCDAIGVCQYTMTGVGCNNDEFDFIPIIADTCIATSSQNTLTFECNPLTMVETFRDNTIGCNFTDSMFYSQRNTPINATAHQCSWFVFDAFQPSECISKYYGPTSEPTLQPTNDPSTDPTLEPTTAPTLEPTTIPTNDLTPSTDIIASAPSIKILVNCIVIMIAVLLVLCQ